MKINIPQLPDRSKIGSEISRMMDEKNISKADLSRAIGKPRTTIYNIIDGNASYKLLELAMNTIDNWEEK